MHWGGGGGGFVLSTNLHIYVQTNVAQWQHRSIAASLHGRHHAPNNQHA